MGSSKSNTKANLSTRRIAILGTGYISKAEAIAKTLEYRALSKQSFKKEKTWLNLYRQPKNQHLKSK